MVCSSGTLHCSMCVRCVLYASYSTLRRVLSATAVHVVCEHRSLHLVQQVCCTCVLPSTGHSPFWDWGTGTAHTRAAAHCSASISSHLLLLASRWFLSVRGADCWATVALTMSENHSPSQHAPPHLHCQIHQFLCWGKRQHSWWWWRSISAPALFCLSLRCHTHALPQ